MHTHDMSQVIVLISYHFSYNSESKSCSFCCNILRNEAAGLWKHEQQDMCGETKYFIR